MRGAMLCRYADVYAAALCEAPRAADLRARHVARDTRAYSHFRYMLLIAAITSFFAAAY